MSRAAAWAGITFYAVLLFAAAGGTALAGDCSDPSDCQAPPDNAVAAGCVAGAIACGALIARSKKKDEGGEWDDGSSDFGDSPAPAKPDGGGEWTDGSSDFSGSGGTGGSGQAPQPAPTPSPTNPPARPSGPPDGPLGD